MLRPYETADQAQGTEHTPLLPSSATSCSAGALSVPKAPARPTFLASRPYRSCRPWARAITSPLAGLHPLLGWLAPIATPAAADRYQRCGPCPAEMGLPSATRARARAP